MRDSALYFSTAACWLVLSAIAWRQSRKMAYKVLNFQPIEGLINGQWQRLARADEAEHATHTPGT